MAKSLKFSERTYDLAADVRAFVENVRGGMAELGEARDKILQESSPDPEESAAHNGLHRVMGPLDDLGRDLVALDALAASLQQVSTAPEPAPGPAEKSASKPVAKAAPAKAASKTATK